MTEPTDKMRADWNDHAKRGFMQYTSGTETGSEQDYVASAVRDGEIILRHGKLGSVDTSKYVALDVGCGVGRIINVLAPRMGEVHGVDVSDDMIRMAGERLAAYPNVKLQRIDGTHLRMFPDRTFDLMWSYSVFYHIPRRLFYGYLAELSRVMKPGGIMVFHLAQLYSLKRWWNAIFRIEPDPNDYVVRRFYTNGHLRSLAAQNGFEVVSILADRDHDLWNCWRKK